MLCEWLTEAKANTFRASFSVTVAVISSKISCQKKPQGHITLVEFSSRALDFDVNIVGEPGTIFGPEDHKRMDF